MPVTGPSITNNKFESEQHPSNSIQAVVPLGFKAVKFTDGYGKTQMRLVIEVKDQLFLLPEDISNNAKACQKWFTDAYNEFMNPTAKPTAKKSKKKAKTKASSDIKVPAINLDSM